MEPAEGITVESGNSLGSIDTDSHRTAQGQLCPWPRCCPWLVIVAGVALGHVLGFSPWLFLGVGAVCLLSGCLGPV